MYMVFIDLTKAFDSVNKQGLWQVLRKIGSPEKFVKISPSTKVCIFTFTYWLSAVCTPVCVRVRTTVASSGSAAVDDDVGGSVKHVRTYQVYRGMSPEAVSRLEVLSACRTNISV